MQDLQTLKRMLYQIWSILDKKQKIKMVGAFFVTLTGSLLELLGVTAMLPFIESILSPEELMKKSYIRVMCNVFNIHEPQSVVIMVGIGIIVIYLIKNAFLVVSNYVQVSYSNNTFKELSVLMMQSYMNRPYSFFVENGSSVILQGINTDAEGVYKVLINGFGLLSESLVIISIAIYLISVDWILAMGVLAVGVACLIAVTLGLKKRMSRLSTISRRTDREKYRWATQISGGIKDILVYNRQKHFLDGFKGAYEESCKAETQHLWFGNIPERIIEAFCVSGIILTVLIRLWMGVDVNAFVPGMAVFAMGAFRLLPSISRSQGYINHFVYFRQHVEAAYDNIMSAREYQNQLKELAIESGSQTDQSTVGCFENNVRICDIRWRYPKGQEDVLKGVSLTINKGEAIGIIGESGSGKSTFADIILRLYYPQSGEILMDGVNINAIPLVWSKIIGYVPQNIFLEDSSIRANVVFGADNSNDDRVWEALRKASLERFVRELPDGLDTLVGERGVKFSGGQRQRIAIARALFSCPQILILDEATSALDNETEEAVMEAIDSLAGTMTLIIIAHRVTTLRGCDRIYEIVEGKAVERNKQDVIRI